MEDLLSLAEQPGVLSAMVEAWGISEENARMLYANMAIYTHGLSALIMAGAAFSDEELRAAMNGGFSALASQAGVDIAQFAEGRGHEA